MSKEYRQLLIDVQSMMLRTGGMAKKKKLTDLTYLTLELLVCSGRNIDSFRFNNEYRNKLSEYEYHVHGVEGTIRHQLAILEERKWCTRKLVQSTPSALLVYYYRYTNFGLLKLLKYRNENRFQSTQ